MSFFRLALRSAARPNLAARALPRTQLPRFAPRATFSAAAGLSKGEIETRVLDVLKGFEKVDPAKVRLAR